MSQGEINWENITDLELAADLVADKIAQIESQRGFDLDGHLVTVSFQLDPSIVYRAVSPEGLRYDITGRSVSASDESGNPIDLSFWALNKNSGVLVLPSEGRLGLSPDGALVEPFPENSVFDVEAAYYPEPDSFLKVSKKNDPPKFKSFSNDEDEHQFLGQGFGLVFHHYSKPNGYLLKPSGTYMLAKWIDPELEWKAGRRLRIIDAGGQERAAVFVYFKSTPAGFLVLPQNASPV